MDACELVVSTTHLRRAPPARQRARRTSFRDRKKMKFVEALKHSLSSDSFAFPRERREGEMACSSLSFRSFDAPAISSTRRASRSVAPRATAGASTTGRTSTRSSPSPSKLSRQTRSLLSSAPSRNASLRIAMRGLGSEAGDDSYVSVRLRFRSRTRSDSTRQRTRDIDAHLSTKRKKTRRQKNRSPPRTSSTPP